MKHQILLIASLLLSASTFAQPQMDIDGTKPVKLVDVIKAHNSAGVYYGEDEEEHRELKKKKIVKEGKDYHFDRWVWYWQSHTDQDGYLVSPLKTYEEWQKYTNGRAQMKSTATANANWVFQGPTTSGGGYEGVGRIQNIEFHPTDPNTYWVCTAGGGAWKTTNNGVNWSSITEMLPVLGTSDIDVNPKNPNVLYLCTGDRDASDSYSIGVLKSTNGGASWVATGLSWTTSQTKLTNSLVINKVDTNSLTLAASDGIYKSNNGGAKWTNVKSGNFKQVLYHPTDTNILYATTYNGGADAQIFRSADGGKTWTQRTSFTGTKRITLAVTPASIGIVKAIVATNSGGLNGIYNSTDTGKTFTKIYGPTGCNGDILSGDNKASATTCGKQGWYDLSIAIDPNNANKVFAGGVNTWYSTNGGTSWNITTQWWAQLSGIATVHADKHWLAFHPLVANRLFECNDGGIYRTDNPLPTSVWNDLTHGMGITQFYRNAVANNTTFVLGGSQDNGTKMYQGGVWSAANGGDGMDCQIDFVDSNTFYTATQYGNIDRVSSTWGDDQISDNIPGGVGGKGGWITPYIMNPRNHDGLIAGYKRVYYSPDAGTSWIDLFGKPLDTGKNINRIAMTPANDSFIYITTDNNNSKIYFTNKFKGSVVTTYDSLQAPYTADITDIKVDPKKKNRFWITYGGFGSPQVVRYDSGVWTQMKTGLPNVPVHCFEIDSSNGVIYVGTDVGVFYQDTATGNTWAPYTTNMPNIEVADLAINYKKKELWAATYGRGMWKSAKQDYTVPTDTTDTTNVITMIPYVADDFSIAPNPSNGHFKVKTGATAYMGKEISMRIVDNTGRVIWGRNDKFSEQGSLEIDVQQLPRGIYIFEVTSANSVVGRKRIILN